MPQRICLIHKHTIDKNEKGNNFSLKNIIKNRGNTIAAFYNSE